MLSKKKNPLCHFKTLIIVLSPLPQWVTLSDCVHLHAAAVLTRWLWNVRWLLYRCGPLAFCPIGQPSIYTEAGGRTGHRGISDVFEGHSSDDCLLFNPISFRVAPPLRIDRVNGQNTKAVLLALALWPLLSLSPLGGVRDQNGCSEMAIDLFIYLFSGGITSFHAVLCHIQRRRI